VWVLGRGVRRSCSQKLHLPALAGEEGAIDLVAGAVVAGHVGSIGKRKGGFSTPDHPEGAQTMAMAIRPQRLKAHWRSETSTCQDGPSNACTSQSTSLCSAVLAGGFTESAQKDGRLWQTDVDAHRQWPTSPLNAGHQRDFYRLSDPREDPLAVETKLSEIEGTVAPILQRLDQERRLPDGMGSAA
jgi:Protein of unknown function (DUF4238)